MCIGGDWTVTVQENDGVIAATRETDQLNKLAFGLAAARRADDQSGSFSTGRTEEGVREAMP
jgi:hypothetical protein